MWTEPPADFPPEYLEWRASVHAHSLEATG